MTFGDEAVALFVTTQVALLLVPRSSREPYFGLPVGIDLPFWVSGSGNSVTS